MGVKGLPYHNFGACRYHAASVSIEYVEYDLGKNHDIIFYIPHIESTSGWLHVYVNIYICICINILYIYNHLEPLGVCAFPTCLASRFTFAKWQYLKLQGRYMGHKLFEGHLDRQVLQDLCIATCLTLWHWDWNETGPCSWAPSSVRGAVVPELEVAHCPFEKRERHQSLTL